MRNRDISFWIGLLLYSASFFLWALGDSAEYAGNFRGYDCAQIALLYPWLETGKLMRQGFLLEYYSLLISGWINPVFLISLIFLWRKRDHPAIAILRGILLLMIPFCWIEHPFRSLGCWCGIV